MAETASSSGDYITLELDFPGGKAFLSQKGGGPFEQSPLPVLNHPSPIS